MYDKCSWLLKSVLVRNLIIRALSCGVQRDSFNYKKTTMIDILMALVVLCVITQTDDVKESKKNLNKINSNAHMEE